MKCIKCEKAMSILTDSISNVDDGADFLVRFHYGSRHDMCFGFGGRFNRGLPEDPTHVDRLIASDGARGFICDDCFEKHADLFEPHYDVTAGGSR